MANEPSRIGQQVDSLLQPTNPNRLHIVPQTSSMIQQQLTGEKSSNSSAQPPRAGAQDQDVAPNYTDIPASPYNRRVNKRRRYLEPHLGGQSYASVFSSTESDAVSDNDRYLFQPIAHPSSAHNASTPSNVSHNPHSQMRLSTVTAYAATESTSATSAGHPDRYSYGNENGFGHLPSFSHAGSMGTSESDFQPAPSVVHDAFSAVSANGFSKTQEVIYVDAHPQPFTNSQDEFTQDAQGKGWTIPQIEKGLTGFPRSLEEIGFGFQEGRALLDESEHATLSPVVTTSVSPSEIDASASADGEGIITNEDQYLTPGSTTSTSDDEHLLEDQDNIPSGAHGSTLEATHINPLKLLPVEVWAQIVRHVVEVSQDDKERLRNLGSLRYLNITNLKREVNIAQWSVAMIRAGRPKAIDGLEPGRRKESEKKCLGAIRKVVFTVPRRDCLKDNLLYDCGQKSFINIIGQLITENITWLILDSFSELGAMAHQAFDKAIDQMTNLQVVQLPRLSKRSKVAKASIAFVVSSGPKGITIYCPAYTSLSIVSKLMGRKKQKDLRLIFHDIRGSTTETDFKVLFEEVDFENVHTVCGVSIDMMLLARYILPGVLQNAKRISMFQCTGVREFYDTQSEHENAVEFLQWHDLPGSGPSTMQAQLQQNALKYLGSSKNLQHLDMQSARLCPTLVNSFADNVPATRLTSLSLDTADLRTDQSVKATYMAWSSKLIALTHLHHPVYGASTWLGTGLPGDWQPDSDYESSISDLATGYKGCLNLKHVAIGAARSQTYGNQIHEIDLCHDLSEKVANIFKNNYINLETISVNLSGSNPFFGAAKPRSFLVEKDGTVGEVSDYDTCEHLTKDTCSLLGLETSLKLVNYLPAELLKIMPSDKVSFKEHWNR